MRRKRYDVVIVGCGPGGAMAGRFTALNGAETLIIEQKRQIGFPVYDSMGIIYSKSEMEETTGERIDPAIIYSKADGLSYISPQGKRGKPQLLPDGVFVNRQLFEKSLAISAVRAGAEIMLHTRAMALLKENGVVKGVIIKNGSELETIPCLVVIAADGCYQLMARLAGLNVPKGNVSTSIGAEFAGVRPLDGSRNIDEIYLDDSGEGAYRYVVPYGEDRFTIGYSIGRGAVKTTKSLKQRLDGLIKHLENIGKYEFSKASPVSLISGSQVRLAGIAAAPKLASDGFILVGDAAAAPLYGSRWAGTGLMAGACWTARIAGTLAAKAIKIGNANGELLNMEYRKVITQTLGGEENRVLEASAVWRQIFALSPEAQERAVEEIGQEIAALHFYSKGALPLRHCLEPVQSWFQKLGKRR